MVKYVYLLLCGNYTLYPAYGYIPQKWPMLKSKEAHTSLCGAYTLYPAYVYVPRASLPHTYVYMLSNSFTYFTTQYVYVPRASLPHTYVYMLSHSFTYFTTQYAYLQIRRYT